MALSGNGRTLVVGDQFGRSRSSVRVWSRSPNGNWTVATKLRASKFEYGMGKLVAVSYDGRTIASELSNSENTIVVKVWGLSAQGTWVQQLPRNGVIVEQVPSEFYATTQPLVLSGDGSTMAMSIDSNRGGVTVWKRTNVTWARQATLVGGSSKDSYVGTTLAISRDGRTLVAGSFKGVFIWRLSSKGVWDRMRPLLKGSSILFDVALSGDGRTLAASEGGRTVSVWTYTDMRTWVQKYQAYPPLRRPLLDSFSTLKLSNNGRVLAASVIGHLEQPDYVQIMRLSSNGTWVSLGSKLISKPLPHPLAAFGIVMALSGDGLTLAVGYENEEPTGAVYVFTAGA